MRWGVGWVILAGLWCRRTQLDPLRRISGLYILSVNPEGESVWPYCPGPRQRVLGRTQTHASTHAPTHPRTRTRTHTHTHTHTPTGPKSLGLLGVDWRLVTYR